MKRICSIAVFLLCLNAVSLPGQGLDIVETRSGKVSGSRTADGAIISFKGIPFAQPPVDGLRWKAPVQELPWTGVRQCTAFGPSPMQAKPVPFSMWSQEFLIPEEPISEDCLYLNVWTGAGRRDEKRPVLVWIYGGGFVSGGSGVPIYDGEAMARRGIVFVSINYRVGIFGFFAHPELTAESGRDASGNYGLMDQIAALEWVRDNIAAFGGDPGNVTIAGQSAGSMSVNCLVASPLAKNLFRRAIAQSGASFSRNQAPLQQAEEAGVALASGLNLTSLEDLRALPAADLLKAQGQGLRGPVIDGYVLPKQIAAIFEADEQNKADLLTGWNQDEGLLFGPVKSADAYKAETWERYGDKAEVFLSFYPAATDEEAAGSQLNVSRDMIFGAQNYAWANGRAQQAAGSVYVYRFTRKVPGTGEYAKYGAFHTGEVPYAYDNVEFVARPWEDADRELERVMSAYWVNFVKSGNPNGPGLPEWPAYEPGKKQIMLLGQQLESKPLPDAAALDFLYTQILRK